MDPFAPSWLRIPGSSPHHPFLSPAEPVTTTTAAKYRPVFPLADEYQQQVRGLTATSSVTNGSMGNGGSFPAGQWNKSSTAAASALIADSAASVIASPSQSLSSSASLSLSHHAVHQNGGLRQQQQKILPSIAPPDHRNMMTTTMRAKAASVSESLRGLQHHRTSASHNNNNHQQQQQQHKNKTANISSSCNNMHAATTTSGSGPVTKGISTTVTAAGGVPDFRELASFQFHTRCGSLGSEASSSTPAAAVSFSSSSSLVNGTSQHRQSGQSSSSGAGGGTGAGNSSEDDTNSVLAVLHQQQAESASSSPSSPSPPVFLLLQQQQSNAGSGGNVRLPPGLVNLAQGRGMGLNASVPVVGPVLPPPAAEVRFQQEFPSLDPQPLVSKVTAAVAVMTMTRPAAAAAVNVLPVTTGETGVTAGNRKKNTVWDSSAKLKVLTGSHGSNGIAAGSSVGMKKLWAKSGSGLSSSSSSSSSSTGASGLPMMEILVKNPKIHSSSRSDFFKSLRSSSSSSSSAPGVRSFAPTTTKTTATASLSSTGSISRCTSASTTTTTSSSTTTPSSTTTTSGSMSSDSVTKTSSFSSSSRDDVFQSQDSCEGKENLPHDDHDLNEEVDGITSNSRKEEKPKSQEMGIPGSIFRPSNRPNNQRLVSPADHHHHSDEAEQDEDQEDGRSIGRSVDSVLSSSLEAETRLLKQMGWKEEDDMYEPLTEDEVREFQDLILAHKSQAAGNASSSFPSSSMATTTTAAAVTTTTDLMTSSKNWRNVTGSWFASGAPVLPAKATTAVRKSMNSSLASPQFDDERSSSSDESSSSDDDDDDVTDLMAAMSASRISQSHLLSK